METIALVVHDQCVQLGHRGVSMTQNAHLNSKRELWVVVYGPPAMPFPLPRRSRQGGVAFPRRRWWRPRRPQRPPGIGRPQTCPSGRSGAAGCRHPSRRSAEEKHGITIIHKAAGKTLCYGAGSALAFCLYANDALSAVIEVKMGRCSSIFRGKTANAMP